MYQSKEEILRVFDEWGRNFAPSNFIQNEKNAKLLADYVLSKYGLVSISYLNEAVKTLTSQLDWVPQMTAKTLEDQAAKFAAREAKRIEREKLENNSKWLDEARAKADHDKEREKVAKMQADYKTRLESLIGMFAVNSSIPGRVDYSRTNSLKEKFSKVRVPGKDGKTDWLLTFQRVEKMMQEY